MNPLSVRCTTLNSSLINVGCNNQDLREEAKKYAQIGPDIRTHEIEIRAFPKPHIPQIGRPIKNLSDRFIDHATSLAIDPHKFFFFLKPVEEALSHRMKKQNLSFSKLDDPTYLIGGNGYFFPGPPPKNALKKKLRIIDETLLELERPLGINQNGAPTFVGYVMPEVADDIVKKGHVFKEDAQISRLSLHGKNSHRLFILALIHSLKGTEFEWINATNALQLLIHLKFEEFSAWTLILDNTADIVYPKILEPKPVKEKKDSAPYSPQQFNFSCRSPFVLNSLLLCFGDQFQLPNLMYCMRDSHWKQIMKMVKRVQADQVDLDPDALHDVIMTTLLGNRYGPADIGEDFSFTLRADVAIRDPKYKRYLPHPLAFNVKQKSAL